MATNNMDKIIHDTRGNSIFLPGITPKNVMDYYKGFAETYEQVMWTYVLLKMF